MQIELLLFLCIFISKIFCENCTGNLSNFLNDFLMSQDITPQIVGFVCYKRDVLIELLKCVHVAKILQPFSKFELSKNIKSNSILFLTNLECPESQNFLENIVDPKYYKLAYRWLILSESNNVPDILALPDSNVIMAKSMDKGQSYELKNIYRIDAKSNLIFEPYANWTGIDGLNIIQKDLILSRRRRDLSGKILRATIVVTNKATLNHLEDYRDKHIDSVAKVNFLLTKHLISSLNGTMNYSHVDTWGYRDKTTGNWSGMVGNLTRNEADIGGTALFVTADRVKIIEYISMTTPTRAVFIFREPPLSYVTNIYYLPFSGLVWICCGALVTLSIFVIFLTMKLEKKLEYDGENLVQDVNKNLKISDFILSGVSGICQMGSLVHPKIISSRISTIFLLIALLFFYTSYTANIVALLQSTTKSIRTLSNLLESQLTLGLDDNPYNRYYFPAAKDPVRKAIYQRKILTSRSEGRYMNITAGIEKVRNELFAFHIEGGVGYKIIEETFYEHEKCNLMTIPFIQVVDPWLAIQKHSPYKEMLKVNLFKIREHGLQARQHSKIYTKKPVCSANGQSFGSVRLTDCYAAVVIVAIGYGLAVFVFLLERLFKKCRICLI